MRELRPAYDEMDDFWFVSDDDGYEFAGPFLSEEDAWDWIESFGDMA